MPCSEVLEYSIWKRVIISDTHNELELSTPTISTWLVIVYRRMDLKFHVGKQSPSVEQTPECEICYVVNASLTMYQLKDENLFFVNDIESKIMVMYSIGTLNLLIC